MKPSTRQCLENSSSALIPPQGYAVFPTWNEYAGFNPAFLKGQHPAFTRPLAYLTSYYSKSQSWMKPHLTASTTRPDELLFKEALLRMKGRLSFIHCHQIMPSKMQDTYFGSPAGHADISWVRNRHRTSDATFKECYLSTIRTFKNTTK